jgi:hypothetical protein
VRAIWLATARLRSRTSSRRPSAHPPSVTAVAKRVISTATAPSTSPATSTVVRAPRPHPAPSARPIPPSPSGATTVVRKDTFPVTVLSRSPRRLSSPLAPLLPLATTRAVTSTIAVLSMTARSVPASTPTTSVAASRPVTVRSRRASGRGLDLSSKHQDDIRATMSRDTTRWSFEGHVSGQLLLHEKLLSIC